MSSWLIFPLSNDLAGQIFFILRAVKMTMCTWHEDETHLLKLKEHFRHHESFEC